MILDFTWKRSLHYILKKENNSFLCALEHTNKILEYLGMVWLSWLLFRPEIHWIIQLFSVKNSERVLLTNTNFCWLVCSIWYLLSEQEITSDALNFLPKNQQTRWKLLNFEFWINGELSKSAKFDFQSQFSTSKIIAIFLNFF